MKTNNILVLSFKKRKGCGFNYYVGIFLNSLISLFAILLMSIGSIVASNMNIHYKELIEENGKTIYHYDKAIDYNYYCDFSNKMDEYKESLKLIMIYTNKYHFVDKYFDNDSANNSVLLNSNTYEEDKIGDIIIIEGNEFVVSGLFKNINVDYLINIDYLQFCNDINIGTFEIYFNNSAKNKIIERVKKIVDSYFPTTQDSQTYSQVLDYHHICATYIALIYTFVIIITIFLLVLIMNNNKITFELFYNQNIKHFAIEKTIGASLKTINRELLINYAIDSFSLAIIETLYLIIASVLVNYLSSNILFALDIDKYIFSFNDLFVYIIIYIVLLSSAILLINYLKSRKRLVVPLDSLLRGNE